MGHLKLLAHTCMQLKTEWARKDKRAQCIWKLPCNNYENKTIKTEKILSRVSHKGCVNGSGGGILISLPKYGASR